MHVKNLHFSVTLSFVYFEISVGLYKVRMYLFLLSFLYSPVSTVLWSTNYTGKIIQWTAILSIEELLIFVHENFHFNNLYVDSIGFPICKWANLHILPI